jgi:chitin disaccharide deacetylase
MTERYLIINADDYGMCHASNAAVEDLFDNGYITSTTLMAACPWAEEALQRAKRNPRMNVGLHLTLNSEWELYRWGPVSRTPVPSLLDGGGYFHRTVEPLLAQATADDVKTELQAQLDWMTSRGYTPTHMDNHMGSLYGLNGRSFLKEAFELCARHGFPFRLPRSPEGFGPVPPEVKETLPKVCAEADRLSIGIVDNLLSLHRRLTPKDSYETVKERYLGLIRGICPGISELYLHPALECAELRAICPAWQMRVWEHRLMKDDDVGRTIDNEGIKLTTWKDAPFQQRAIECSNVSAF